MSIGVNLTIEKAVKTAATQTRTRLRGFENP